MDQQLTKQDAAEQLLDQALAALLDRDDAIAAIVLSGSAENIFCGLLKLKRPTLKCAEADIIPVVRDFVMYEDPASAPISDKSAHDAIASTFNWLRHNDREGELQEQRRDFHLEAAGVIERACENAFRLTGLDHPRMLEMVERFTGK